MTRKELQEKLNAYPENMEVFIPSFGEFDYGIVTTVRQQTISFHASEDDKDPAKVERIVIDED